ncbi:unnamed protein product, partial [Protopolystoma xenopodis]
MREPDTLGSWTLSRPVGQPRRRAWLPTNPIPTSFPPLHLCTLNPQPSTIN